MDTISNDPYLYTIDNFLSDKECRFIINTAKENMKLARVSRMNKDDDLEPGTYKGRTNSSYCRNY